MDDRLHVIYLHESGPDLQQPSDAQAVRHKSSIPVHFVWVLRATGRLSLWGFYPQVSAWTVSEEFYPRTREDGFGTTARWCRVTGQLRRVSDHVEVVGQERHICTLN
jgi:hypothetical protein